MQLVVEILKKDYYKILGIKNEASRAEIRRAYRRLAFRYHPDHNKSGNMGTEFFRDIKEAYEVLTDPVKRKDFDSKLKVQNFYAPSYGFSRVVDYMNNNPEQLEATQVAEKKKGISPLTILKPFILLVIAIALMMWIAYRG